MAVTSRLLIVDHYSWQRICHAPRPFCLDWFVARRVLQNLSGLNQPFP